MIVLFIELGGSTARAQLETLAQQLSYRPDCQRTRLLFNSQQDLHLLVSEWPAEGDVQFEPPPGARLWRFQDVGDDYNLADDSANGR